MQIILATQHQYIAEIADLYDNLNERFDGELLFVVQKGLVLVYTYTNAPDLAWTAASCQRLVKPTLQLQMKGFTSTTTAPQSTVGPATEDVGPALCHHILFAEIKTRENPGGQFCTLTARYI